MYNLRRLRGGKMAFALRKMVDKALRNLAFYKAYLTLSGDLSSIY